MQWADLTKVVANLAPTLGSVLPIPGGALIGQAIAKMFGGDVNNPDDLINRINSDPDAALKLKQIELEHQEAIQRLIVSDKQSARDREIQFIEKTGRADATLKNLAYITTFGFFATLLILFLPSLDINTQEKQLIMLLLGMLASKWQTIIDYYFGTSRNDKNEN